jgi:hypothetical protein
MIICFDGERVEQGIGMKGAEERKRKMEIRRKYFPRSNAVQKLD